jgi:hypothetical protein
VHTCAYIVVALGRLILPRLHASGFVVTRWLCGVIDFAVPVGWCYICR